MAKKKEVIDPYENIYKALDMLYEEGVKSFKADYVEYMSHYERRGNLRWQAIGMAIAKVETNPLHIANLASDFWETHNRHGLVALLNWVFGHRLYPNGVVYLTEAKMIKDLFERKHIVLKTDDNKAK